MPDVRLSGCRPEPLASYLKALGVLKVVGEQRDPEALGWWDGEEFVLTSVLSGEGLVQFFREEYHPTPILAPWNKDSGFYRRGTAIEIIERSSEARLAQFRHAIAEVRKVLAEYGWTTGPGKETEKTAFMAALRSRLPDACLGGMDAIVALVGNDPSWAPLFVAGGVDGRFEFTRRYAESVLAALGIGGERRYRGPRRPSRGASGPASSPGLRMALFGEPEPGATVEDTGGLLAPGSVDAPNASEGFMGSKRLNPWNYVLALEGAVVLAGSVSRRFGSNVARAAFPFAVGASAAGHAGAGTETSRGEVWLPLWDRPLTAREARQLFREGRAEWAGRIATTAADMARAIISLGVDRGLSEFRRYGIQGRSGKSYLAVAMGRWPVVARPEATRLAELDEFLGSLRAVASRRDAPVALADALRRLEATILDYAAYGGRDRLIQVLEATSHAELALAR
ncbi:MAG: type I-U CRISPR-associated protein Csx17, partial [Armatimonadota bacterium]|nr:type I-U CRISPR-associated protein Csx17 [Armatimonadota bacterium]